MRKFLTNCFLFTICVLLIFAIYGYTKHRNYNEYISKSLVFKIPDGEALDVVLAGNSAANMELVLTEKGYKTFSMNSLGGGIQIQKSYLEYFFMKKNTAKKVLYFLDSSMLSTDQFDKPAWWLFEKPELGFIKHLSKTFDINTILSYLITSLKQKQADGLQIRQSKPETRVISEKIDSSSLLKRLDVLHHGRSEKKRKLQEQKFIELVTSFQKHASGSELILIINAQLFGKDAPNKEELVTFLDKIKKEYGIKYYDYSDIYNNPDTYDFFYDFDHLNTKGQTHLTEDYLIPILQQTNSKPFLQQANSKSLN